jgi:DNA-binding Lrp family transcriptional regulator
MRAFEASPTLDELDVRILRALVNNRTSAPFSTQVKTSLREIARTLEVDDVTVRNRFKRFQEKGLLSGWRLIPNPGLFGYKMMMLLVDTAPKSPRDDMIRKLKLVQGTVVILNFHGDSLGVILFFGSDQSLTRTIELISRITNAENITRIRAPFPQSEAKQLTETDWAIIRNMGKDALKSQVKVSQELGFTTRTVRNRLQKLERERALMIPPKVNLAATDGMISVILFYSYTKSEVKSSVDLAMLSHFDGNYLWSRLADPEVAYLVLVIPSMVLVKQILDWAKEQPGVASARVEITVEAIDLWDKVRELFSTPADLLSLKVPN